MLETILAISGKPGLYKLVTRGRQSIIVETLDEQKKRMPAFAKDKIISLADIAMYTDDEEKPLKLVLKSILDKEDGKEVAMDIKKASGKELREYFSQILPDFDRDRVHDNDIRKLIQWYNIIVRNNIDFSEDLKEEEGSGNN
ncbi:MAG: DUF5606 domain-containing protein [Bacteroidaceae bacterium]|nr:DUF5606 domain-containing protein [Bacteroidaceae bacterium]